MSAAVRDSPGATDQQKVTYSFAQLGCTLSHLRAARLAFESGAPASLVMEDDLVLRHMSSWTHSLGELMARAPAGWRILQLHMINTPLLRNWCSEAVGFRRWEKLHWSSAAYLLSRQGASALSLASGPLDAPDYPTRLAAFIASRVDDKVVGHANPSDHTSPLVSDYLIFRANLPHAYSFSRPLFGLSPFRSTIQTPEVDQLLDMPMRAVADAYFAPDKHMERCASLSFSGSLATGMAEGTTARRGVRHRSDKPSSHRVGCFSCGDGGLLHSSLIVVGACDGEDGQRAPPFQPLPLANVTFPQHAHRVKPYIYLHTCRKRPQRTRPITCAEVDRYFASPMTPGGKLHSSTSCSLKFGHLGCCDVVPHAS
jgi:hypothetical protein